MAKLHFSGGPRGRLGLDIGKQCKRRRIVELVLQTSLRREPGNDSDAFLTGETIMRNCWYCGKRFSDMQHILLRPDFCSEKCLKAYERDEAFRRTWEAQSVHELESASQSSIGPNQIGSFFGAPREAQGSLTGVRQQSASDEALAGIWTSILGVARYLRGRQPLPSKPRPAVLQMQEGTGEWPVYFIGFGVSEFRLAQLMGRGHSIFGVEVPWPLAWRHAAANNQIAALPKMEQLVAPYTAAISLHRRSSPCILAGHSFGGLMAFEAAHQLRRQGVKVELIILLDAPAKYATPRQIAWQKLTQVWQCGSGSRSSIGFRLGSSLRVVLWMLVKGIRALGRAFLKAFVRDPDGLTASLDEQGVPMHWGLIERVFDNAVQNYRLRCLDCRGVLFRADAKDERYERASDGTLGWGNLFSGGLEIIEVTGDHFTMLRQEPHVLTLARELNKLLSRFAQSYASRSR